MRAFGSLACFLRRKRDASSLKQSMCENIPEFFLGRHDGYLASSPSGGRKNSFSPEKLCGVHHDFLADGRVVEKITGDPVDTRGHPGDNRRVVHIREGRHRSARQTPITGDGDALQIWHLSARERRVQVFVRRTIQAEYRHGTRRGRVGSPVRRKGAGCNCRHDILLSRRLTNSIDIFAPDELSMRWTWRGRVAEPRFKRWREWCV